MSAGCYSEKSLKGIVVTPEAEKKHTWKPGTRNPKPETRNGVAYYFLELFARFAQGPYS